MIQRWYTLVVERSLGKYTILNTCDISSNTIELISQMPEKSNVK
jgi:hypothetical protein